MNSRESAPQKTDEDNSKITISVSNTGKGKVFTYGFKEIKIHLKDLGEKMNRYSVSGSIYKDGHRKSENIIKGSNIILVDCDEPGQAEAVEGKLYPYNYVKVPSASNSEEAPYKWHYALPTQKLLSIYPAAYRWQVEEFFRQIGITDDMIDVTGSYDIARQFAPASVVMNKGKADDLIEINDTGLCIPVGEPDEVLCKPGAKTISPKIKGKQVSSLPSDHLWFKGDAITYTDAIKAVKAEPETIVSGFGCPHDNHEHEGDISRGYGFAFVGQQDVVTVKCAGNACKDQPYFMIPETIEDIKARIFLHPKTDPIFTGEFQKMLELRIKSLEPKFKFGENMLKGFFYYGATFNECVYRNTNGLPEIRLIIPAPTGSGKSVASQLYLAYLARKGFSGILIVGKIKNAIDAVNQINFMAKSPIAACTYTISTNNPDSPVRVNEDELKNYPIIVITHKMFLSRSSAFKNSLQSLDGFKLFNGRQRACCIIDEAIDFKKTIEFSSDDLQGIIGLVGDLEIWDTVDHALKMILESNQCSNIDTAKHPQITDLMEKAISLLRSGKGRVGYKKDLRREDRETEDRDFLIRLLDKIAFCFDHKNIIVKQGKTSYFSVDQDLTNQFGTVVILDATATSTLLYKSHMQNRSDILMFEMPKGIRNYQYATMHIYKNKNYKQSKNKLVTQAKKQKVLDQIIDHYLEILYNIVSDGSKILVVTFKDIVELFKTKCQNDHIKFIHWGIHEGTNSYSNFSKAAVIGLFRKSERKYIQDINAIQNNIIDYSPLTSSVAEDARAMIIGGLVSDLVQFFNRTRSRIAIDKKGNCLPTDFYIFDDGGFGSFIPTIKQEMPGIQEAVWEPETLKLTPYPIIKKSSADNRAERIIKWLLDHPNATINAKTILESFTGENKITQRYFKEVLKNQLFKELLDENNINIRIKKGRYGGTFFDIPENFVDKLEIDAKNDKKTAAFFTNI